MKNKVLIVVLFISSILIGCSSSVSDELAPGVDLYNEGTVESLMEAREFFVDYLSNNEDEEASEWLADTNNQLISVLPDAVDEAYANKDFEESLNLVNYLIQLDNSQQFLDAKQTIEFNHNEQIEFDKFSETIKDNYDELYTLFNQWRNAVETAVLEDSGPEPLKELSEEMLPNISSITLEVQESLLSLDHDVYLEAQNELFNYVNKLEGEFYDVLTRNNVVTVDDYNQMIRSFTSQSFNQTFSEIQKTVNDYLNQTNEDGEKITNIKGSLNLIGTNEQEEIDQYEEEPDLD